MRGINKEKTIKKYKNDNKVLYPLADKSGEVIGQEVDADNFLYYVVKRGNKIEVVSRREIKIVPRIHQVQGNKKTIKFSVKTLP